MQVSLLACLSKILVAGPYMRVVYKRHQSSRLISLSWQQLIYDVFLNFSLMFFCNLCLTASFWLRQYIIVLMQLPVVSLDAVRKAQNYEMNSSIQIMLSSALLFCFKKNRASKRSWQLFIYYGIYCILRCNRSLTFYLSKLIRLYKFLYLLPRLHSQTFSPKRRTSQSEDWLLAQASMLERYALSVTPSTVSSLASQPKNSLITTSAIISLKCSAKLTQYCSLPSSSLWLQLSIQLSVFQHMLTILGILALMNQKLSISVKILLLRFHFWSQLKINESFNARLKATLLLSDLQKRGCLSGEKKD